MRKLAIIAQMTIIRFREIGVEVDDRDYNIPEITRAELNRIIEEKWGSITDVAQRGKVADQGFNIEGKCLFQRLWVSTILALPGFLFFISKLKDEAPKIIIRRQEMKSEGGMVPLIDQDRSKVIRAFGGNEPLFLAGMWLNPDEALVRGKYYDETVNIVVGPAEQRRVKQLKTSVHQPRVIGTEAFIEYE